jgi:Helix-turn-helix domain
MEDENGRAARARKGSPFLSTAQAAHYVGLSRRTLEKMRTVGGGPKYRKHGRYVRYHIDDLEIWSAARTKQPDGKAFLERSDGDRHQFRFIVSAKDGVEYDDLKPFIRRVMQNLTHCGPTKPTPPQYRCGSVARCKNTQLTSYRWPGIDRKLGRLQSESRRGRPRRALIAPRLPFSCSRRRRLPSVGRVGRREVGRSAARRMSSASRSIAAVRFKCCDRWRRAVMTSTPSCVSFCPASADSRARTSSGREGERRTSKRI